MFGGITWFHKLMVVLVIINIWTVIVWNDRTRKKNQRARAEAEKKRWLEREMINLYRISLLTTEGEVYQSMPELPICKVVELQTGPALKKRTSFQVAQEYINNSLKAGYCTVAQVTIPVNRIKKVEVVGVQRKA
jgi:hypothetical protein